MGTSSVFDFVNVFFERMDQFLAQLSWWVFWVLIALCAVFALIQLVHHRNMYHRQPRSMRAAVRLSNLTSVLGTICFVSALCLAASKLEKEYIERPIGFVELLPVILTFIAFSGALIALRVALRNPNKRTTGSREG